VASFWPRRFWHTDLQELRDSYLAAQPEFTRLRLLDTQILFAERVQRTLVRKAALLKAAMIAMATSILLSAGGLTLHSTWGGSMEREPDPQAAPNEPDEVPPPFDPDPRLVANLEQRGKPTEAEVRDAIERLKR
jgi:hypothetical protein